MTGMFVAVVGPSGAGKDTLIRYAEARLGGVRDMMFVRRLVTRTPGAFEDHDTISEAEFAAGIDAGRFALSWRAHGHGYAVPLSTRDAVRGGAVAVCNLSRGAVAEAEALFGGVVAVLVTAPAEVIATRLAARGRETVAAIEARLKREAEQRRFSPSHVIDNDGPVEAGGGALVDLLDELRRRLAATSLAASLRAM
jgi:ribose 1,5-bisphosphokinase